jgi:hypothetical protein
MWRLQQQTLNTNPKEWNMKRNLILTTAMLAVSLSSFAFSPEPRNCESNSQQSSMQSKEQKHNKKEKKDKKKQDQPQQDSGGFSIYG